MVKCKKRMKRIFIALLLCIAVFLLVLIIVNTIAGKKGFYYDSAIPRSDFIFFDRCACYVNLEGGKNFEEPSGKGMVEILDTMGDRKYCNDFYFSLANTLIVIDEGRWIGVRFGKRIYMLQCNVPEVSDPYECYRYIFGHPYFVLNYSGKKRDYSDEDMQNWMKMNQSKLSPSYQ